MNNGKAKWIGQNWDRRGRGGSNRGGFGRGGNRGSWGRNNFRGQPYGNQGGFRGRNDGYSDQGNRRNNWQNRPKRDTPGKRLSEEDIGVLEYISEHEGFNGIIKSRYSDFQVSEINEEGEVAVLTDQNPPEPVEETVDEDEDLLLSKYNLEILPMETWDSINKLVMCKEPSTEKVEIDVAGMTKEQRTKIHDAVKKAFGDSIVGSTVNVDDKKFVRFEKYRKGVRIDTRVKWIWPGEYVYFIVHKENCDTMDAAVRIAERLRLNIKPSMLGYAGTKDRRAKTSQWFSLRKVDPRRVAAACRGLQDLHLGNYSFRPRNLRLGMLKGNQFRIALRNVTAEERVVDEACQHLKERGFINYYGLQRFGTRVETPTYEIGIKLFQGNLKEAIEAILEEREGPLQATLRRYREAGAEAALRVAPHGARVHGAHVELRLLRALARAPNDLLGAFNKLARNTRLLYLHSYQSLIWNRATSRRIQLYGLRPAEGDLVPLGDVRHEDEIDEEESDEEEESTDKESDTDNTERQEPKKSLEKENKDKNGPKPKVPVKVLTKEDVESGRYTIFDIIMPLPGYNIDYPPNMKQYYEEMMTKDGLDLLLKTKIKGYSMSGAYRHMVVRPLDVQWTHARYSDPYADLIPSDLDLMRGHTQPRGIKEDGKYKALILTMSLPASCYATMALRELLKVDTSGDNQALQNNYHKKRQSSKSETESKGEESETDRVGESETEDKSNVGAETESGEGEKRKLENNEEVESKKMKTGDENQ